MILVHYATDGTHLLTLSQEAVPPLGQVVVLRLADGATQRTFVSQVEWHVHCPPGGQATYSLRDAAGVEAHVWLEVE